MRDLSMLQSTVILKRTLKNTQTEHRCMRNLMHADYTRSIQINALNVESFRKMLLPYFSEHPTHSYTPRATREIARASESYEAFCVCFQDSISTRHISSPRFSPHMDFSQHSQDAFCNSSIHYPNF